MEQFKFNIGDKARVVRKTDWPGWTPDMIQRVPFEGIVNNIIESLGGVFYMVDHYWYPENALDTPDVVELAVELDCEDVPGYTDSIDPEKAMQVLRNLCGKGSY